ncbi:hypothetical protein SK128_024143, partial [Halocaridina rubra]
AQCTPWEKNLWLRLNYLEVSEVAYYCGAHFSALLYLELHCEAIIEQTWNTEHGRAMNRHMSRLQRASLQCDSTMLEVHLLKIYSALGDGDGVDGSGGGSKLLDSSVRAIRSQHQGQWIRTLEIYDASKSTMGIVQTLKELKFYSAVNTVLNDSSLKPSPELLET